MFLHVIGFMLASIVTIIILIDVIPLLKDWVSRVGIGRYNDKHIWSKAITKIGIMWLKKTPKIRVTDNTRLTVIDMLKGNYVKGAIQHWQEAALVLGILEYLKKNDDKQAEKEMVRYVNSKFDSDGQWRDKPQEIDAAILTYSIMKIPSLNIDHYKKAFDYTWELIKDHIGDDGTVKYRKSMKNYRYVDTIGFICPFLISYGIRYNMDECVDLAVKQIKEFEQYGMLENYYIPCHAYTIRKALPLGLFGWGRGLGWFAIGVIDAWIELPEDNRNKLVLEDIITKFAKAVLSFQQKNGSWNWTVTRRECRADSSATAALCWFLLNAARLNDISKNCLDGAYRAIDYLMKVTRRSGAVDFSQGDTKDIGIYSVLFNILPFTQGLCIRMANSIFRTKEM